jgi:hypothetical protein
MNKNGNQKFQYEKYFTIIKNALNQVDPECLQPGKFDGAPKEEYDPEARLILQYLMHEKNRKAIKLNTLLLKEKINTIWEEMFGSHCNNVWEVVNILMKSNIFCTNDLE